MINKKLYKKNLYSLGIGLIIGSVIIPFKLRANNSYYVNYDNNNICENFVENETISEENNPMLDNIVSLESYYYDYLNAQEQDKISNEIENFKTQTEETKETIKQNNYYYNFIPLSEYEQNLIHSICCEYNVPFDLMLSIAKQESNFNMLAFNPISSDWGMFQVNESSWNNKANELGFYNYKYDLGDNTRMACWIVRHCLELSNGDIRVAMNYYRTGTPYEKYEADSDYATIIINNIYWIESLK